MSQIIEKIPKKIHYCWFGNGEMPEPVLEYLESWKKYCPDYELVRWDESNFDVDINDYVREAYESKKWAFVTDYVRLYALYNYGGVYMDTDVELLKNIDEFLEHEAFSGFDSPQYIPTGIMGARKSFPLFKELLDWYVGKHFIVDGKMDMTTNAEIITDICREHGFKGGNKKQNIEGFVVYPTEYFCPIEHKTLKNKQTKNTYAIHHFTGTWLSKSAKARSNLLKKLCKMFGNEVGSILFNTVFLPYRVVSNIREQGIKKTITKIGK